MARPPAKPPIGMYGKRGPNYPRLVMGEIERAKPIAPGFLSRLAVAARYIVTGRPVGPFIAADPPRER